MKLVHQGHQILSRISIGGIEELQRIEIAGRTCYKSEDKISPDGESAKRFVKMIIDNGHEAMLEHSSLSVRFICSRGVSHEIVRHRLFSFAQESTRYCNYSKGKFGGECSFIVPPDQDWGVNVEDYEAAGDCDNSDDIYLQWIWYWPLYVCEGEYMNLLKIGWTPQEARDVLPNALKTEIVVTGNYREWRHFFKLRCDEKAHPHIRLLAKDLLEDIKLRIPVVFDDL